jgi:hypothetical protein
MRRLRRRAGKAGPGLAFAYLFFLLFPHFAAITHSHANDGGAHHHAFLSAHDLVLEREALEAAPQGEPNGELAPDAVDPIPDILQTLKIVGPGLVPEAARAHTHFQEDPNLPALALPAYTPAAHASIVPDPETVPEFIPALAILASPARAPPRA